jgi:hypothetical protein
MSKAQPLEKKWWWYACTLFETNSFMEGAIWHVDPLLGNNHETNNYTTTVPQTSMFPWQIENTAIMEETFSTWCVLRCYKQGQLAVAVRELLGFSYCELLQSEAGN